MQTVYLNMYSIFFRFVPSLAFFISVHATFFTRLQDGPFWRALTEPSRTFSREKFLKNLLMFDNVSESVSIRFLIILFLFLFNFLKFFLAVLRDFLIPGI